MKIIVFGGTGLLGSSIVKKLLDKKIDCRVSSKNKRSLFKSNLLSKNKIIKFLKKNKPHVIINCAGETNVDYCNNNLLNCYKSNVLSVKNIVNCIKELNLKCFFVHISTDQVYNSFNKKKNAENDINVTNNYSLTKLLSEIEAKKYTKTLIIRTNFFGKSLSYNRKSFSDYIISELKSNKKVNMASNVIFNPIHIDNLSDIIYRLIKKKITGIFNIGSKDSISKYKFALNIAKKFKLNKKNVVKYKSSYSKHKRPEFTFMSVSKLKKKIDIKLPTINEGIKKL